MNNNENLEIEIAVARAAQKIVAPLAMQVSLLKTKIEEIENSKTYAGYAKGRNKFGPSVSELQKFANDKIAVTGLDEVIAYEADRLGLSVDEYVKRAKE